MSPNRTQNPVTSQLSAKDIEITALRPKKHTLRNGIPLDVFISDAVEITRLDIVFEAGKAYADNTLAAIAAMALVTEGTSKHTAQDIANFLSFRGITIERSIDSLNTCFTIYLQNKYLEELLPLLKEIFCDCTFPKSEYEIYLQKKRQEFENQLQKTTYQASVECLKNIFGTESVYSKYLSLNDFDSITLKQVKDFHRQRYQWQNCKFFVAGNITANDIDLFDLTFGDLDCSGGTNHITPQPSKNKAVAKTLTMPDAVQSSIRFGKTIDLAWDSTEFAKLMIANTLLGGYFGSRLMMNIREDKGYCYGIYSSIQVERNTIYMIISTEVGTDVTQPTIKEIFAELKRLQEEPVGEEELSIAKSYLVGDFMRSVDGVYELLERERSFFTSHSDDTYTRNYLDAIESTTAQDIMQLAQKHFNPNDFVTVTAGNI